MTQITPFRVDPLSFHELVVQPMFGDVLGPDGEVLIPSTEEGDWNIVDSERRSVPIIDIKGNTNILKRKDSTCKLIYSPVARLENRYIHDTDLYAATEDCQEEFYQGCFRDYRNQDWEVFGAHIMPVMNKSVAADVFTNKYFGDITRASDPNGIHSWNKFDGIFTHYLRYVQEGLLESPINVGGGTISASDAYALLQAMYQAQDEILDNQEDADKAIYVSKSIYDAYGDWLISTGNNGALSLTELQSGRAKLYFKGVELRPKKWNGILKSMNSGVQAHAAILTMRGNFLFKTDSSYGGGPFRNEAVRVMYSEESGTWKRTMHLRGGTEIVSPQHSVLAITSI